MITAIILAIFASFLWGITNHIDKFIITGIDESKNSIKILLSFLTGVAGIVLISIWLILSHFAVSVRFIYTLQISKNLNYLEALTRCVLKKL